MKNKWDKLEALFPFPSSDIIGINEIGRDKSHDWISRMEDYWLFRMDKQGR